MIEENKNNKASKKALGSQGLAVLMGAKTLNETQSNAVVQTLDINTLEVGAYQPREDFDFKALESLADSIRKHGILQPLVVRKKTHDGLYEIVAGERRFRAAKMAELKVVPVVIKDLSNEDTAVIGLIENLQREDLNSLEQAQGVKRLIEEFGLTHDDLGKVLGKSRSVITNLLRVLSLPYEMQQALRADKIQIGHAKVLAGLPENLSTKLFNKIIDEDLSVRNTESLAKELSIALKETEMTQTAAKIKQSNKLKFTDINDFKNLIEGLSTKDAVIKLQASSLDTGYLNIEYKDLTNLKSSLKNLLKNL